MLLIEHWSVRSGENGVRVQLEQARQLLENNSTGYEFFMFEELGAMENCKLGKKIPWFPYFANETLKMGTDKPTVILYLSQNLIYPNIVDLRFL